MTIYTLRKSYTGHELLEAWLPRRYSDLQIQYCRVYTPRVHLPAMRVLLREQTL